MASIILGLFSIGYITMSRYIKNTGAFYAYISAGIGENIGTSASFIAIFAYICIQMAIVAMLGFFLNLFISEHFHSVIPWWVLSAIAILTIWVMSVRKVEVGGMLLGVLMLCEIVITLVLDGAVLMQTNHPLTYDAFKPSVFLDGNLGIAFVFAIASFIGFESTAIYAEECRDPKRTVPRATLISLLVIALFFCFSSWSLTQVYPTGEIKAVAAKDPGNFVFTIARVYLGQWSIDVMNVLLITSLFAAALAFHNNISRYIFSIARDGLIWKELCAVHKDNGTPHNACHIHSAIMLLLLIGMGAVGVDPILYIFSFGSAMATLCVLLLQTGVSLSVILFFQRHPGMGEGRLSTRYIPLLSLCTMVATVILVLDNFNVIMGNDSWLVNIIPLLVALTVLIGYAWSKHKKREVVESAI
ncbi:amino acid permease [Pectobacterium cacticida]